MEPNLFVYTPIVLPFPHLPVAAAINRGILRLTLAVLRRRLEMDRYQLWTFIPTALPYMGMPGRRPGGLLLHRRVVELLARRRRAYWADGVGAVPPRRRGLRHGAAVAGTAGCEYNSETHLALHGVDHQHFAQALDDETTIPDDLADCPRPVVGFFGLIHDWIDISLLAHVAEQRPDWTVAVIGKANVDISSLERLPNVKLLGRRPYEELPRYCKAFSVGVMPFALNELTTNVNPIKMREYLSAGLPVVSTDLPEVRGYSEWVRVARSPDEFLARLRGGDRSR